MSQLSHFGVKGMKWGVRRELHKSWKKEAKSGETATAVYNDAVNSFNKVLPKLNKDPAFADMATNRNTRRQYDAVVQTIFNQHLATASLEKTFNADLNRGIIYQMTPDGMHMRATEVKAVPHADISSLPEFDLERDRAGFVIGCKVRMTAMAQDALVLAYLAHYGVKGQRWGVRRTKAALARAAKREGREVSPEHARTRELLKKKRSELTNQELKFLNERLQLESTNKRLDPNAVSLGKNRTLAAMATVGTVAGFLNSPPGRLAINIGKSAVTKQLAKPLFGALPIKVP